MAVAKRDDNGFPTWIGLSCVDGVTPIRITVNPSNGCIKVDDTTVISVVPANRTPSDDNGAQVIKGVSSADANVILPLYVNPATGAVLIDL